MILGMTTSTYTLLHVVISLIGIGSGPSSYGSDPGEIFRFKL